jgi:hypothetical protein
MLDTRVTLQSMLGGAVLAALALAVVFTTLGRPLRALARPAATATHQARPTPVTWHK